MEIFLQFLTVLWYYLREILPILAIGFLISGLVHEFVSTDWVGKHLGKKGLRPIFYATLVGTILPVCCTGVLPIAVSFYKKGAKLGPILAFLVATPATSVAAILVTYRLLGFEFMIYLALTVIILGFIMGLVGNLFSTRLKNTTENEETCTHSENHDFASRMRSALKFGFWEMPREIGPLLLLGIVLAAVISVLVPESFIQTYLAGAGGYAFAAVFGLVMYICDTASVPLVHAFLTQGIDIGAALTLLLVGPITGYGALLTIRKIFGSKILLVYVVVILAVALLAGYGFSILMS